MKKIIFLLLISFAATAQTRLIYDVRFVADYTNAQETSLASTLIHVPAYSLIIYNTDLAQIRYWSGSSFISMTDPGSFMPSNGNSQYVKLNSNGKYPAIDGSLITALSASNLFGSIPFVNTSGASSSTSASTGTITVNMVTPIITITPTGACTFNASGGSIGQRITFVITTSGVSSFTLTWGTNFKTTGTLSTGTTSGKIFSVSFLCTNGTQWVETGRTTAQ